MRALQDAQRVQLVAERLLPEDELRGVRPVEAVYAVGARYAVLEGDGRAIGDSSGGGGR